MPRRTSRCTGQSYFSDEKNYYCRQHRPGAVCREGDGGHKFVSFSVAYAERKTNETDEQGNPVTVAQWAECEIYVGPESSAEGLLKLLTKGRFIYAEASDKAEAWIDKDNQLRSRILYRITNFQV